MVLFRHLITVGYHEINNEFFRTAIKLPSILLYNITILLIIINSYSDIFFLETSKDFEYS